MAELGKSGTDNFLPWIVCLNRKTYGDNLDFKRIPLENVFADQIVL